LQVGNDFLLYMNWCLLLTPSDKTYLSPHQLNWDSTTLIHPKSAYDAIDTRGYVALQQSKCRTVNPPFFQQEERCAHCRVVTVPTRQAAAVHPDNCNCPASHDSNCCRHSRSSIQGMTSPLTLTMLTWMMHPPPTSPPCHYLWQHCWRSTSPSQIAT
jgi:hypothetical protein